MAQAANQVERAPAGNGTARPFQVRFNGELLRTKGGVARRFKTEADAQKALDKAVGEEIFNLAQQHGLSHTELARHCEYSGAVNGREIIVSVFDRDPIADLHALRSALAA